MATANGNGKFDATFDVSRRPPTSEQQVLNVLREDLHLAKERVAAVTAAFDAVTGESASRQLRGPQLIHNASREVTIARMDMLRAHHRLNDFLNAGIVPDDLRKSG